ncbi:hypothetical protein Tco_0959528 [Tanacetum coccineum]
MYRLNIVIFALTRLKGILIGNSKLVINMDKFFKTRDNGVASDGFPNLKHGFLNLKLHLESVGWGRKRTSRFSKTLGTLLATTVLMVARDSDKFDEGSSCFEEDFIGPTMDEQADDGGDSNKESGEEIFNMENERSPRLHPWKGQVETKNMYNYSPCTVRLPSPPPYNMNPTHSPFGDLNDPLGQPLTCVQEGRDLDDLMCSFQKLSNNLGKNNMLAQGNKRKAKQKKKKIVFREGDNKQSWVKDIIGCDELVFFGIQESKLEVVYHFLIRSTWPYSHIDWACSSSIGASGGIITMWDNRVLLLEHKISNRNFLRIIGTWDFNVVRSLEERVGSNFDDNEANTFSDFLLSTGLCDLPLGGRRYTRFDKEWRKASKFDSYPTSDIKDAFSSNFPDYTPTLPDYFPTLKSDTSSPEPFR